MVILERRKSLRKMRKTSSTGTVRYGMVWYGTIIKCLLAAGACQPRRLFRISSRKAPTSIKVWSVGESVGKSVCGSVSIENLAYEVLFFV